MQTKKIRTPARVQPLKTPAGNPSNSQFAIFVDNGVLFQSYNTLVAMKTLDGKVYIDPQGYRYSRTTMRYLCQFLGEDSIRDIDEKLKNGEYEFATIL